ncbi:MAG: hypothetical protein C0594_07970 [Marinilabiliales bacterium]|nr:MAG: hypothetical protein C0594_07970 [Marinilabiliales bacterium]
MITKQSIDAFLNEKNIALIGVSAKKKNFGRSLIPELQKRNHTVFLVHPDSKEIDGIQCISSIKELPNEVNAIHISVSKDNTEKLLDEIVQSNIDHIWIQQMSETQNIIDTLSATNKNFIYKQCLFMFMEPVKGIHSFHRGLKSLFGKLPK